MKKRRILHALMAIMFVFTLSLSACGPDGDNADVTPDNTNNPGAPVTPR
jgi:predicted small lipoprotein YifL